MQPRIGAPYTEFMDAAMGIIITSTTAATHTSATTSNRASTRRGGDAVEPLNVEEGFVRESFPKFDGVKGTFVMSKIA